MLLESCELVSLEAGVVGREGVAMVTSCTDVTSLFKVAKSLSAFTSFVKAAIFGRTTFRSSRVYMDVLSNKNGRAESSETTHSRQRWWHADLIPVFF